MNCSSRIIQSRMIALWFLITVGLMPSVVVAGSQTARESEEEELKSLIVMVVCKSPGGAIEVGAGIIFGAEADRLFVATAAHVVQSADVQVKFRWLKTTFKANVLRKADRPLDLAVLGVPVPKGSEANVNALPFDRLGDDADSLKRGDPLYSLGNPRGVAWSVNKTPDPFLEIDGDNLLTYGSQTIQAGHSGGALLNERWELVGMIVADNPPTGRAVSIARVLATLKAWKYPVALRAPYARVSAGGLRTCAVMPGGLVQCWGNIDFQEPFLEEGVLPIQGVRFRSISAGYSHVCGIASSRAAYCWGANGTGKLGGGLKSNTVETSAMAVQGGLLFTSISAGGGQTCGVTTDSRAYCWGQGIYGGLGNDAVEDSPFPVPVAGGHRFKSVSSGYLHTCGVTTGGTAYCWGSNELASLGDASQRAVSRVPVAVSGGLSFQSISAGHSHTCGLTTSGEAYCWGSNKSRLGNGSDKDSEVPVPVSGRLTFKSVNAAIGGHTCGVTTRGVAYCWGLNSDGQLGNGTKTDSNVPVVVSGGLSFALISPGNFHTCGVTTDGAIYCWGAVEFGGLGTGSKTGSTKPVRVPRVQ